MKPSRFRPLAWRISLVVFMLVSAITANAQAGNQQSSGDNKDSAGKPGAPPPPPIDVIKVTRASDAARLGGQLDVYVSALDKLIAQAQNSPITLYLDGYALKGLKSSPEISKNVLHFMLERTEIADTQNNWNSLLSISPKPRTVSVSVGYGPLPLPSDAVTQLDEELEITEASVSIRLGQELVVYVTDLNKLKTQAGSSPITLYLDGYALKGLKPGFLTEVNALSFDLERTDVAETQDAWNKLLGGMEEFPPQPRTVSVSVGYGTLPLPSKAETELDVAHRKTFVFFFPALAIVFGLFVWLARRSNLIRDLGPQPGLKRDDQGEPIQKKAAWWRRLSDPHLLATDKKGKPIYESLRKTYSLASTQLAFWLFVILASYLFIWAVTTNQQSLSKFALGILGISSATAVGSTFIDASKRTATPAERQKLDAKLRELQSQRDTLVAAEKAGDATASAKLADVKAQITDTWAAIKQLDSSASPQLSRGFWTDILSDDTGITIHRFQIVAWTAVLGLVFAVTVVGSLTMPDFDGTLLALMGISSGAYISLKPTEKKDG